MSYRQAGNKIIAESRQRHNFHKAIIESYQSLESDSRKICFQVPVPNSFSEASPLLSLCKGKINSSRIYFLFC